MKGLLSRTKNVHEICNVPLMYHEMARVNLPDESRLESPSLLVPDLSSLQNPSGTAVHMISEN